MDFFLLQQYGKSDDGLSTFWTIVILILVVIALNALFKGGKPLKDVLAHWHHRFETPPFSPNEFYEALYVAIEEKGMRGLGLSYITYSQGGIFSPKRHYLRISYGDYIYDVCAAPFAKEFFVSWWMGEFGSPFLDFFVNLPVLGKLFKKRTKTFYELDTEIMFKEAVSGCVKATIDKLTEAKGLRKLSQTDWVEYQRQY